MTPETSTLEPGTRQQRHSRSSAREAVVGLLRTTDRVRRYMATVMEPFGVTPQQYNVLRILRGASPESLPTLEIAERMLEQAPGITRLLDRLERKGLVARERCAEDRRQVLCSITPAGLDLLRHMDEPIDVADDELAAMLSPPELEELIRLLDAMRAGEA